VMGTVFKTVGRLLRSLIGSIPMRFRQSPNPLPGDIQVTFTRKNALFSLVLQNESHTNH